MKTSYTQKCLILYAGLRYENEYFPSKKSTVRVIYLLKSVVHYMRMSDCLMLKNNLLRIVPMSFFFGKGPCALILLMAFY